MELGELNQKVSKAFDDIKFAMASLQRHIEPICCEARNFCRAVEKARTKIEERQKLVVVLTLLRSPRGLPGYNRSSRRRWKRTLAMLCSYGIRMKEAKKLYPLRER